MASKDDKKMSKKQKNGYKSSTSSFISINKIVLVAIAGILFYFSIDPRLSDKTKELTLFESLDGPFKLNNELGNTDKLFTDQLLGPESLASYKGDLYTGTKDGRIVRIHSSGKLSTVVSFGPESCLGKFHVKSCGRPLGVRVTSSGDLYTVDAFNGLIKVTNIDGSSGQATFKILYDIDVPVNGNASVFLDDLVIDERSPGNRIIYMTDASCLWDMNNVIPMIMDTDDSGRILKYSEATGKIEVVLDKLAFPNGIEFTDSKDALLIGEFTNRRILKYYLSGPKAGTSEVLLNLPGEPDNIRRSGLKNKETYWIAISAPRTKLSSLAYDFYLDKPVMRKIVITCYQLIGGTIERLGKLFGFKKMIEKGGNIKTLQPFWETYHTSLVIEIDATGKVLQSLYSNDGYVHSISEVTEKITNDGTRIIRLGSYANDYLGQITLSRS